MNKSEKFPDHDNISRPAVFPHKRRNRTWFRIFTVLAFIALVAAAYGLFPVPGIFIPYAEPPRPELPAPDGSDTPALRP